jgi:hypothetical protein
MGLVRVLQLRTYWPTWTGSVSDDFHLDLDGATADRVDPHGILRARDDSEAIPRPELGEKGCAVVLVVVSVVGIGFAAVVVW